MKRLTNNKGFTLIELLVVITLIAILAVAVLAAINPVEQRRKAQDTGARTASADLAGALDRYYATYGCYPWSGTQAGDCTAGGTAPSGTLAKNLPIDYLKDTGEIRQNLLDRLTNAIDTDPVSSVAVSETADELIVVCFAPVSNTYQAQADSDSTGATGTTYICID